LLNQLGEGPVAHVTDLLSTYGYWLVFACVALETTGVPGVPGEATLVAAALYSAGTGRLEIGLVVLAAASGAIVGDNLGYLIGRACGTRLLGLLRRRFHIDERRLEAGRYLFRKHGGKVVFFGRFVALLRVFAAFIAGVNRMSWTRFLAFNAAGGIVWASLFGFGAFFLGDRIRRLELPAATAAIVACVAAAIIGVVLVRREEARLEEAAGGAPERSSDDLTQ
jgi:membrane protein DedA with SNARE-associated domain